MERSTDQLTDSLTDRLTDHRPHCFADSRFFSLCKKSVDVSQMQAQNISFYIFNFKMCLFNFENCICTLSVCIGHGSRSRRTTMTKCRVTQPPPKQLQIQFYKSSRMDFQNSNFQMQSFSVKGSSDDLIVIFHEEGKHIFAYGIWLTWAPAPSLGL